MYVILKRNIPMHTEWNVDASKEMKNNFHSSYF